MEGGDPLITDLWTNFELVLICIVGGNSLICLITTAAFDEQVVPHIGRLLRPLFFLVKLVNVYVAANTIRTKRKASTTIKTKTPPPRQGRLANKLILALRLVLLLLWPQMGSWGHGTPWDGWMDGWMDGYLPPLCGSFDPSTCVCVCVCVCRRQIGTSIIRSIPKILDVVILLVLTILMFSIVAFLMFAGVTGRYPAPESIFAETTNNTCAFSLGFDSDVNASE